VLELVNVHRPDVLALQETKCSEANFPRAELEAAGYTVIQSSAGQWAGVALLVREPLVAVDACLTLPGDTVPSEARWCEATVGGVRFISTYVPNGRSLDSPEMPRKLAFLDAAAARVAELRATGQAGQAGHAGATGQARQARQAGLIVAGDINVAPADGDVYDPAAYVGATHVSPAERGALAAVMERGELVDAYRQLHPTESQFTWWDYRAGNFHKNIGMRIDLVLVTPDVAARLETCGIDREFRKGAKPSDHAPLLASFGAIG
jgi:exodeoxyribonuclease-3